MAEKMIFLTTEKYFEESIVEYDFYPGFAVSQKQKSILSLHDSIHDIYPNSRVLEISTKSTDPIGVELSAFRLMFYHDEIGQERHLENVFQSSKVFENGGPYRELLNVEPKNAKRDERLNNSGRLKEFNLYGESWPLNPRSMFYDWIYIKALSRNQFLSDRIMEYDIFTDIEFNHKKSINCQARAAAIFVALSKKGELNEFLNDKRLFETIYGEKDEEDILSANQIRFFNDNDIHNLNL